MSIAGEKMKAWKSKGEWLHKNSGNTFCLEYNVICNDEADPIEVIKEQNDMTGMTYLRGSVDPLSLPIAIPQAP